MILDQLPFHHIYKQLHNQIDKQNHNRDKGGASISDCESNCGISSDSGILRKFARKDTADIVTMELTNR